jgi:hypothetical protein
MALMKTIKFTCILLIIICSYNSCNKGNKYVVGGYDYYLLLNIQDALETDLVKGIGSDWLQSQPVGFVPSEGPTGGIVIPDLYKMDIVYPKSCMDIFIPPPGVILAETTPKLGVQCIDDIYYLYLRTRSHYNDECRNPAENLTFKLKCPRVFGDDAVHDIITYWKEGNKPTLSRICYRIELDGNESTEIIYEDYHQISRAIITLENK